MEGPEFRGEDFQLRNYWGQGRCRCQGLERDEFKPVSFYPKHLGRSRVPNGGRATLNSGTTMAMKGFLRCH